MMTYGHHVIILVTTLSLAACHCPLNEIVEIGNCSFRVHCYETLQNIMPTNCRGSINGDKEMDVTITRAREKFDENIDPEFLNSITSLTVTGYFPSNNVDFLNQTTQLKKLVLSRNHLQNLGSMSPFFYLDNLEHLDLSYNRLTDLSDLLMFEVIPNKLTFLSLAHNYIRELPGDAFEDLSSLIELDLSYNQISDLSEEPFNNLTMLQVLNLENNTITNLNDALNNLDKLKHLYLAGNKIHSIGERLVSRIQQLHTFDISGNKINHLKPTIFLRHWVSLSGICKIKLSDNHIKFLPNGTAEILQRYSRDLTQYKVKTDLDLSKNSIHKIGFDAFKYIVQLIVLDLSDNRLTTFDVNNKDFVHIRVIKLSHNFITHVSIDTFRSMVNLQTLDLSYNHLRFIPDFAYTMSLVNLNISFNKISRGNNFRIMTDNRSEKSVLDLSNNSISLLDMTHREARINVLILRSNRICDASLVNVTSLLGLKTVKMNENLITTLNVTSLNLPMSVTTLDLSNNLIQDIGPATFHRLHHLKILNLSNNNLTTISYGAFRGLTSLSTLDLSNNKLQFLDSKLLMDLKLLEGLSLKFNGMQALDYKGWLGHVSTVKVEVEGNDFSCKWLSKAISDYNNGFSKMMLYVDKVLLGPSVEGIPCSQKNLELEDLNESDKMQTFMADERLLVINQKILDTLREQTYYLRRIFNQAHVSSNEIATPHRVIRRIRKLH